MEETVNNFKERSNETNATDRANSKNEIDRIKAATYDKYGRYNGEEADVLRQKLKTTAEAYDLQEKMNQRNLRDSDTAFQAKLADRDQRHATELENTVKASHDSAQSSYSHAYEGDKTAYDELKPRLKKLSTN